MGSIVYNVSMPRKLEPTEEVKEEAAKQPFFFPTISSAPIMASSQKEANEIAAKLSAS